VTIGVVAAVACVLVATPAVRADPGPFHIDRLQASVSTANRLTWIHVVARACVSTRELNSAPSEFRLTQFLVSKKRWTRLRTVTTHAPWIVAFGDAWQGKSCGKIPVRDLFLGAEGFAGFDSAVNCLGVELSIKVGSRRSTKRITIRCGSRQTLRDDVGVQGCGAGR